MSYQSYETIEKHAGGRPLKFTNPDLLSSKVDDYFNTCDEGELIEALDKKGKYVSFKQKIPYTLEGLALHLDCCAETVRNYAKSAEFFDIISRARLRIHNSWVTNGLTGLFNPKVTALCLAANTKTYNIVKQTESHDTLTIEQKLRQAKQIEEHVPEAELEDKSDG